MPVSDLPSDDSNSAPVTDERSLLALGYMRATVIMTMALEMALPVFLGVYADYKLGTKCLFLIFGVFFGFCAMIVNFVKLIQSNEFHQTVSSKKRVKKDNADK
ncbi:MAG: AtpZ/AtpI family protein [Planctomycetaceae bacterium]|nr:AtpZ/AtpI family protein [Planctomycetaceae bacterium]